MKLKTLDGKIFLGSEVVVMKKYRSTLPGFKEYPNCFIIKKMKVNKDNYYFL